MVDGSALKQAFFPHKYYTKYYTTNLRMLLVLRPDGLSLHIHVVLFMYVLICMNVNVKI